MISWRVRRYRRKIQRSVGALARLSFNLRPSCHLAATCAVVLPNWHGDAYLPPKPAARKAGMEAGGERSASRREDRDSIIRK